MDGTIIKHPWRPGAISYNLRVDYYVAGVYDSSATLRFPATGTDLVVGEPYWLGTPDVVRDLLVLWGTMGIGDATLALGHVISTKGSGSGVSLRWDDVLTTLDPLVFGFVAGVQTPGSPGALVVTSPNVSRYILRTETLPGDDTLHRRIPIVGSSPTAANEPQGDYYGEGSFKPRTLAFPDLLEEVAKDDAVDLTLTGLSVEAFMAEVMTRYELVRVYIFESQPTFEQYRQVAPWPGVRVERSGLANNLLWGLVLDLVRVAFVAIPVEAYTNTQSLEITGPVLDFATPSGYASLGVVHDWDSATDWALGWCMYLVESNWGPAPVFVNMQIATMFIEDGQMRVQVRVAGGSPPQVTIALHIANGTSSPVEWSHTFDAPELPSWAWCGVRYHGGTVEMVYGQDSATAGVVGTPVTVMPSSSGSNPLYIGAWDTEDGGFLLNWEGPEPLKIDEAHLWVGAPNLPTVDNLKAMWDPDAGEFVPASTAGAPAPQQLLKFDGDLVAAIGDWSGTLHTPGSYQDPCPTQGV